MSVQSIVSWKHGRIPVAWKLYEREIGHDSSCAAQLIQLFVCVEGHRDDYTEE